MQEPRWLLLVYQLPTRPSRARVKAWRRLQVVGALAIKNSVYALPNTPERQEDMEWIRTEIQEMKGSAALFAADAIETKSADEIVAGFRSARQRDYEAIAGEAQKLLARTRRLGGSPRRPAWRDAPLGRRLRLLRQRFSQVQAIDFYPAPGRDEAEAALDACAAELAGEPRDEVRRKKDRAPKHRDAAKFRGRAWVTRPRPGVDRMSSAWLIRRFIDPQARFRFAEKPEAARGAIPFDMYGVEFGHHVIDSVPQCTFETLARRFGISHAGVEWIGRMVHDLDLKEARYGEPEAAAVGRLVDGLRQSHADNRKLLEQGMAMFEALFRSAAAAKAERRAK